MTISSTKSKYLSRWTVGWGYTARCDLFCPFCYSGNVRKQITDLELPLQQAEIFLKNNSNYIRAINFGTGECLLASKFYDLLQLCNRHIPQVKIAITTNGSLAHRSKEELDILQSVVAECDVSLDFAEEQEHDMWRGNAGTWRRAISAIETALNIGLHTSIVMVGTKQTLNEKNIQGLLKIAERYNIAFRINLFMPTRKDFSFVPSIQTILLFLDVLQAWGSALCTSDKLFEQFMANVLSKKSHDRSLSCRIMPNGDISPSTYLFDYNWIEKTPLPEVKLLDLEKSKPFARYTSPPIPKECIYCNKLTACQGGSIERRWLWYGSLNKPDPFCPILFQPTYKGGEQQITLVSNKPWTGPIIHFDYLPTIIALPPKYLGAPKGVG